MVNHHNEHDQGSIPQWTSPGQSWATHGSDEPQVMGQAQQWQGQSGQYYDPSQTYYDPNNPYAWQQGPQFPSSGSQPKPPHKRWWFWAILVVVLLGVVAIIITLMTTGETEADTSRDIPQTSPLNPNDEPETSSGDADVPTLEPGLQRSDDGSFSLSGGGNEDQALAEAQERVDSDYRHYGPGDVVYHLRSDGYQNDEIEYALNNVAVDWNEQALGFAQDRVNSEHGGYSAQEIEDQLVYSGFSEEEIQYALDNFDVDYNEQALRALESYMDLFEDDSESEARQFLEHAGFEDSEIDYAFDNID